MRNVLVFFILLCFPLVLNAQWFGNGSSPALAYYGEINTLNPMQAWNTTNYPSGIIYVGSTTSGQEDLKVGNGGVLTISQGITVKFCTTLSDLRITGTGILNASGTTANGIVFTKDAQATWGHISFEAMTTTNPENYPSVINNCLIQYGDVSSTLLVPANPNQYGGAIHVDFSYVTISNNELTGNKAGWGGAIFVGDGKFPTISRCNIHNNIATTGGGGVYFWKNSSPLVSNCLITFNNVTGTGGGGGIFLGGTAKNVKIINSVISSNTAISQGYGHNIRFFNNTNTPKPEFKNSIIWYPANSIVYAGSTTNVGDFVNCAVQNPVAGSTTNCYVLTDINTDPTGPNFKATNGSDWSLQGWSPCIDIGIDNSTDPNVPLTDYIGNSRIGTTDAGAYESQFYRWQGDDVTTPTIWNDADNWNSNSIPNSSVDVYIPRSLSSYPISSSSQDYTIGSGKSLILAPGAKATFGTLTNNGTLKLESDVSGISSLIINNSVSATVELYLTGGGSPAYKWHYVSSPVSALPVSTFAPTPTIDFAQFFEARPTSNIFQGWIGYDGYIYSTAGSLTGFPYDIRGTNLVVGQGYNYYKSTDYKVTFSGTINISDVAKTITFGGNAALHGFNLLGNPFSSGLNWDYIVDPAYPERFPANTSKGLYFTRNNVQCSYVAGVGYPDASVTGVIPPMQGFFVKTTATSTTLTLPSAARAQNSAARYKGGETIIPLVRIELTNDTIKDNTVIRFDEKADAGFDNDFDAIRMQLSETDPYIYSASPGVKYAINGQPYPETFTEYPLVVNITADGNHTLSASQFQGLDNYYVYLIDKTTGFTADLKTTPLLTFNSAPALLTDRFILKVSTVLTSTEQPATQKGIFNIYQNNNLINIQTIADDWDGQSGSVKILDLAGKSVSDLRNTGFSKNSMIQVQKPGAQGLYVVEIRSGLKRWVGKVVIR